VQVAGLAQPGHWWHRRVEARRQQYGPRLHALAVHVERAVAREHSARRVADVDAGLVERGHPEAEHVVANGVGTGDDLWPFDLRLARVPAESACGPDGVRAFGRTHEGLGRNAAVVGARPAEMSGLGEQDAVASAVRDRERGLG